MSFTTWHICRVPPGGQYSTHASCGCLRPFGHKSSSRTQHFWLPTPSPLGILSPVPFRPPCPVFPFQLAIFFGNTPLPFPRDFPLSAMCPLANPRCSIMRSCHQQPLTKQKEVVGLESLCPQARMPPLRHSMSGNRIGNDFISIRF